MTTLIEKKVLAYVRYWIFSSDAPLNNSRIGLRFGMAAETVKKLRKRHEEQEAQWIAEEKTMGW